MGAVVGAVVGAGVVVGVAVAAAVRQFNRAPEVTALVTVQPRTSSLAGTVGKRAEPS